MTRWRWVAAAVLAGLEIAVLALALTPRVSADYRQYYIERSSDCWPRAVSGTYRMGRVISFLDDAGGRAAIRHKVCGWIAPFEAGSWSRGSRSELLFTVAVPPQGVVITMTAAAFVGPGHAQQRVEVRVNGVRLDDLAFTPDSQGWRSIVVPADVARLDAGAIHLRLDFPDSYSPRAMAMSDDTRALGLLLKAMVISPLPNEQAGIAPRLPSKG